MEKQPNIGDQNLQPVGQNPIVQPTILDKPKVSVVTIIAIGLVCSFVFGVSGYYLGKQSLGAQPVVNDNQPLSTEESIVTTNSKPTIPAMTQKPMSVAGTEDWRLYIDKTYTFRYPSTWNVQPGSSKTEDYFGGDYVEVIAPSPTVTIEIAPAQSPYGFGGPTEHISGETFIININGKEYSGTEDIRTEEGIKKAFVNMTVPIGDKEFHILFGTGYPVNQDSTASYADYQKYRDTILKIISTLEITS